MSDDEEVERFALSRVGSTVNGKWTLDRLIGVGGMAAVYAATHRNTKRAALKILHPEFSAQEGIQKRFLREGYVANMIGHSAVATVDDDDVTEDGCAFLVMELVEGETLEARVRRKGPLPASEVLAFMDQVLHVVATAHSKGIVHRDLKPENLLLSKDGQVKLLDFGIARIRQLSSDPTKTLTEGLMGTPAFMPPEQARGRWAEVDAQSDVWAIGATMFTLLTGRYVHEAQTMNEALAMAMMQRAPLVESHRPELPSFVSDLVNRALIFEKNERWPNATVMLLAVRKAASRLEEEEMQASAQEAARAVQAESADPEILIGVEDDTGHDDYGDGVDERPEDVDAPEEENKSAPLASLLGKGKKPAEELTSGEAVVEEAGLPRTHFESSPKQLAVTTQLSSEEVGALQRAAAERELEPYPSEPSRPSQPFADDDLTAVMDRPILDEDEDDAASEAVAVEDKPSPVAPPRPAAGTPVAPARPAAPVAPPRPAAGAPAVKAKPAPAAPASVPPPVLPPPPAPNAGAKQAQPSVPPPARPPGPASAPPPPPPRAESSAETSAEPAPPEPPAAEAAPTEAAPTEAAPADLASGDRTSDELPTSIQATEKPLSPEPSAVDAPKPSRPPTSRPPLSRPPASRPPPSKAAPSQGKQPDRAGLVAIALAATGRDGKSSPTSASPSQPSNPLASSPPPGMQAPPASSEAMSGGAGLPKSKIIPVPDVPSDGERISRTVHTTTARAALAALPQQVKTRALIAIGAVAGVILLIILVTLAGDDETPAPSTAAPRARADVLLEATPEPEAEAETAAPAPSSETVAPAPAAPTPTASQASESAPEESPALDLEALPVLPNQQVERKWTPPAKQADDKANAGENPFAKYGDIAKKQAEKRKKQK